MYILYKFYISMRHCKHVAGLLEQHTNLIYMWIDSILLIEVEVTILGKLQDSCFLFDVVQTTTDRDNTCWYYGNF